MQTLWNPWSIFDEHERSVTALLASDEHQEEHTAA